MLQILKKADEIILGNNWIPDREIEIELQAEIQRLLSGGQKSELAAIYAETPHNSERTEMVFEIAHKRTKETLNPRYKFVEFVITCHDEGVSFALRASKSQDDLYDRAYADKFVPLRLFIERLGEKPDGNGIKVEPPPKPAAQSVARTQSPAPQKTTLVNHDAPAQPTRPVRPGLNTNPKR